MRRQPSPRVRLSHPALLLVLTLSTASCTGLSRSGTSAGSRASDPRTASEVAAAAELRRGGDPRRGLDHLERLLQRTQDRPARAAILLEMGHCQLAKGDRSGALESYLASSAFAPDPGGRAAAYEGIGDVHVADGAFGLAIDAYERALATGGLPGTGAVRAHYRVAVCHQRLGHLDEARDALVRSSGHRPPASDPFVWVEPFAPRSPARPPTPLPGGLVLVPRAAWGAAPLRPNHDPMGKVVRITVHHTATRPPAPGEASGRSAVRSIQKYHQSSAEQGGRGWADIGYHFLIDPEGRIYEGRPVTVQGAHAGGSANQGNIGIALIGDFSSSPPSFPQEQALFALVRDLVRRHDLSPRRIQGHSEVRLGAGEGGTQCPGPFVEGLVWRLQKGEGLSGAAASQRGTAGLP